MQGQATLQTIPAGIKKPVRINPDGLVAGRYLLGSQRFGVHGSAIKVF